MKGQRTIRVLTLGKTGKSLKKITMLNWSGLAYWGSKDHIKELKEREDSQSQGIYFLYKENDDSIQLYIGESENAYKRLLTHSKDEKKEFFTKFIVFQSKDSSINKAHIKHLEYEFLNLAKETVGITIENGNEDISDSKLSEEDSADIEIFKETIIYILEALEIGIFTSKVEEEEKREMQEYENVLKDNPDCKMLSDGKVFILLAGSHIKAEASDAFIRDNSGYYKKWKELTKVSKPSELNSNFVIIPEDVTLNSSSAAGAIANARNTQGPMNWKNTKTGKMLAEEG